jgi:hypothetical protein
MVGCREVTIVGLGCMLVRLTKVGLGLCVEK